MWGVCWTVIDEWCALLLLLRAFVTMSRVKSCIHCCCLGAGYTEAMENIIILRRWDFPVTGGLLEQ